MRTFPLLLTSIALAGCAALERAPQPVQYECDAGKRFTVTLHPSGDTALIEINQMQFPLRREPSPSGTKYSCDVLTLWTKGREAMLEMEGARTYSNCREAAQTISR